MSEKIVEIEDYSDDDLDDYNNDGSLRFQLKKNVDPKGLAEKLLQGEKDVDITEIFEGIQLADRVVDPDMDPAEMLPASFSQNGEISSLAEMEALMEPITPDRGIMKKTIRAGEGPVVPSGAGVTIHYKAFLEYGDQPFDSTYATKKPARFKLHTDDTYNVIVGLDLAVSSMKKKECAYFIVKPDYAYGERGCPPRIPENATILYEVSLLGWTEDGTIEHVEFLGKEELKKKPFSEIYNAALEFKARGNALVEAKRFRDALAKYSNAQRLLTGCIPHDEDEEKQQNTVLIDVLLNMALCKTRLNNPKGVCKLCDEAIALEPAGDKVYKLLYRKGQAQESLGDVSAALRCYEQALRLKPSCMDIVTAIQNVQRKQEEEKRFERGQYRIMLGL